MRLDIKNLSKTYGKNNRKSLDNFSANLTSGVYGILGPNGAGKSTLMNIIADNIKSDEGEILYNGKNTLEMGRDFRDILGYMPQQQGMYLSFTGRRFLWYIASLKGLSKKQASKKIDEVLSLVNLENDCDRKLGTYSGGMKQRILIAQALLNDPKIILLDEPTAGVDPIERIKIRNFISEISLDKIVLLSTHIVSDIEHISKEVLLINKGKLLIKDSPDNIMKNMEGKVFEAIIKESELEELKAKYTISNIIKTNSGIIAKIISEKPPEDFNVRTVRSSLEDIYLYNLNIEGKI